MKWFPLLLFIIFLVAGYSPQLRTHYKAMPAMMRLKKKALYFAGQRWILRIEYARLV